MYALGLGLVLVVVPLIIPNPEYALSNLNRAGLVAIVCIGLNLLLGFAGQISLGHAAFYGMGAYFSGMLTAPHLGIGMDPWLAMVIGMLGTAILAWVIGIPTLKLHGNYLVMATLGFNIVVVEIIKAWQATGQEDGLGGIPELKLFGLVFDNEIARFYLIYFFVVAAIILSINLVGSRVGRALRALHGSEVAAASLGVNVSRYKVKVFVLSAMMASLAGSLHAHMIMPTPGDFNIFHSVDLVMIVLIGGMGSVWGTLIGAILLTMLPHWLEVIQTYKHFFYGLVLVLILIFLPQGLFVGLVQAVSRRFRPRAKPEAGT
jgi:branched-chain amino acid transport system permease protein